MDASDRPDEEGIRGLLGEGGVQLRYITTAPGRTRQLNLGVRASNGDPILFVDDDVELDVRFHEMILAAFEQGGDEVGRSPGKDHRRCPSHAAWNRF